MKGQLLREQQNLLIDESEVAGAPMPETTGSGSARGKRTRNGNHFFIESKPPVELVVCSTRETLGYWLMSKDILKGLPTALRFLTDR